MSLEENINKYGGFMNSEIMRGLLIPLAGTSAGSALVFFLKDKLSRNTERVMNGFASGVMIAASIWSLLLPAVEQTLRMFGSTVRLWARFATFRTT